MPRASQYLLEGYTYHLTHRCHGRTFLLNRREDRDRYREWLREGVARFRVPVYGYAITRNHVHVVAHASSREGLSRLMHLASGAVAKRYNVSHDRVGSMWEHPYHCTVVQGGRHLLNCLRYVDLNMVRAGEVKHPEQWRWCGYDELTGRRQRYRILNLDHLLERLGGRDADEFTGWYAEEMDRRLANERPVREGHWTEALAVGDQAFVDAITKEYGTRWQFETAKTCDGTWHVRERRESYTTANPPSAGR